MGAENMAKKAAKKKNTRKKYRQPEERRQERALDHFAGCCIALALAFAAMLKNLCGDIFLSDGI